MKLIKGHNNLLTMIAIVSTIFFGSSHVSKAAIALTNTTSKKCTIKIIGADGHMRRPYVEEHETRVIEPKYLFRNKEVVCQKKIKDSLAIFAIPQPGQQKVRVQYDPSMDDLALCSNVTLIIREQKTNEKTEYVASVDKITAAPK